MSKNVGRKIAVGAAIAGAVGYVAGVLTAPKSGKETRKDIKNAAVSAKTDAEKKLKELHSQLDRKIAAAKTKGKGLTGKAKTELDKAIEKTTSAKEKVREVLSALHEGDADDPELKKALTDAQKALKHLGTYIKK